eukprot:403355219
MDQTMVINALESLQINNNLTLTQSVILIQVGLRLAHTPLKYLLSKMIDDNAFMRKHADKYQQFLFNDMSRDIQVYMYGQYIMVRALNTMSNYPQYYPEHISTMLQHDPTFIMPMALMLVNYLLLKNSDHPFLINIRNRWFMLQAL